MASAVLILGGARSGKSRFALADLSAQTRVAIVATAHAGDADMAARIARHRAERPERWPTIEAPRDLVDGVRRALATADVVVVDCVTVWVANLMLAGQRDEAVLAEAARLAALVTDARGDVRLVSNEAGLGVHPPTAEGLRFRDLLGLVNQRLAAACDRVVLLVAGLPVVLKDR